MKAQKTRRSNSIMQDKKYCFVCGQTRNLYKHHVFMGNKQRNTSDEEGCWVWLCFEHHLGNSGVHRDSEFDRTLKENCQKKWMEVNHASIDDFRKVFGKNYV